MDSPAELTVLCADPAAAATPEPGADAADRVRSDVLARLATHGIDGDRIHRVPPRPGKEIDALLAGRVLVIGDDGDLAAVATRLQRRELLGQVEVAYVPVSRTPASVLWSLPTGADAVRVALFAEVDIVPLVRDDNGGVLVGEATIGPLNGTVYVDEYRILSGAARGLVIEPDPTKGLRVTVIFKRWGLIGRRPVDHQGRAVQIGSKPAARVIADGVERDRPTERWTYYRHTEPLRLVRGVID